MSGQARITGAALVNWRGVPFQHYEMDPYVTGLEGINGAGKTTVMIAMYAALLPDLNHLRFRNVGESAGGGGPNGVYGRLGERGGISYSVLDLRLGGGERILAGVGVERRSEPNLDLHPFIVRRLADDVPLEDVLLAREDDDRERVPERDEVSQLVARRGGELHWRKPHQYFRELFEAGALPLDLSAREARSRMDQVLRTSMMGGISRALAQGLRDYLLQRDDTLANTVRRMQDNLTACRRTRSQVRESRRLREGLHKVLGAGRAMFAASVYDLRARRDETRRVLEAKTEALDETRERIAGRRRRLKELEETLAALDDRLCGLEDEQRAAEERLQVLRDARDLEERLAALRPEEKRAADVLAGAKETVGQAEKSLGRTRREVGRVRDRLHELTDALSRAEQVYEDLARKVGLYNEAEQARAEASSRIGEDLTSDDEALESLIARADDLRRRDAERLDHAVRRLDGAEARAAAFAEVHAALERWAGREIAPEDALAEADSALRTRREQRSLAEGLEDLRGKRRESAKLVEEQRRTRAEAAELGVETADDLLREREGLDERIRSLGEGIREADDTRRRAESEVEELDRRRGELETSAEAWDRCRALGSRLAAAWDLRLAAPEDAPDAEKALRRLREETLAERQRLEREVKALSETIERLEAAGGDVDARLLQVRDEVDGHLVAGRFDDVPVEEAAAVEARLGPLLGGVVVDDPAKSAEKVAAMDERPDTVWLLPSDREPPEGDVAGNSVVVDEGAAHRVTRLPDHPIVGRAAREQRVKELEERREDLERAQENHTVRLQRLDSSLAEAEELRGLREHLGAPDPREALGRVEAARAEAERRAAEATERSEAFRVEMAGVRERQERVIALLPGARLLDPPDHRERLEALEARVKAAEEAEAELERTAADAAVVDEGREVLREPPLSPDEMDTLRREVAQVEERLEEQRKTLRALRHFREQAEHLRWADLVGVLDSEQSAVERYREEQVEVRERLGEMEEREQAVRDEVDAAREAKNEAHVEHAQLRKSREQLERELAEFEVRDVSDEQLAEAAAEVERVGAEAEALGRERGGRHDERVSQGTRLETDEEEQARLEGEVETARRNHEPTVARWEGLVARARELGVWSDASGDDEEAELGGKGSPTLSELARERAKHLVQALRESEDGRDLAEELGPRLLDTGVPPYLEAWVAVRDWLVRRVPKNVSESDDPVVALQELDGRLATLEQRLRRKESDLRQSAGSIAHAIHSRVRREMNRVRKLNEALRDVGFGNIEHIRLRAERIDVMTRLLDSLKAQGDLFDQDLPVEEALQRVFEQVGGGRVRGEELLDHRRYLDVRVDVRRKGKERWEVADPSRLSTGEAIGVGAAVLMVVLGAWEENARLLRTARGRSLRFLFLDEANRLDRGNLGVVFEMCRRLGLQLVVAAPEVAHSDGCTVYRLVRTTGDDGRERVQVSGRRIRRRDDVA
ncbi:MAG: chromosome partition protein MukB [Myxococcota bacterium]